MADLKQVGYTLTVHNQHETTKVDNELRDMIKASRCDRAVVEFATRYC